MRTLLDKEGILLEVSGGGEDAECPIAYRGGLNMGRSPPSKCCGFDEKHGRNSENCSALTLLKLSVRCTCSIL